MPSRKDPKNDGSSNFPELRESDQVVATLRVNCTGLRQSVEGGLEEEPEVLSKFQCLKEAIDGAVPEQLNLRRICISPGRYEVAVVTNGEIVFGTSALEGLLERLRSAIQALTSNAELLQPLSAAACGVVQADLSVLEAAMLLRSAGYRIEVTWHDGNGLEIVTPSPDVFSALPKKPKKPKRVYGEVTGVERGAALGAKIIVGGGNQFVVRDMGLEEAIELVRTRAQVSGIAHWTNEDYLCERITVQSALISSETLE